MNRKEYVWTFAGMAVNGMMMGRNRLVDDNERRDLAAEAWSFAEAMVEEGERRGHLPKESECF